MLTVEVAEGGSAKSTVSIPLPPPPLLLPPDADLLLPVFALPLTFDDLL